MYIDSHAHIYAEQFDSDRDEIITNCQKENVQKIYMPNVDHESIERMFEAEEKYPDICIPMMGLHPCSVKKDFEKQLYEVEEWLSRRKFAAVGEIGTDLYWEKTFKNQQEEAFRIQVELAKKHNLPIIIHCRETIDWTIDLVTELKDENLTGIFHCFTGTKEQAERILDLDFLLGIGGILTFKNSKVDREIKGLPLDRMVLETDAPYLSPAPYRGKRNDPGKIPLIAQKLADVMEKDVDEVAEVTTKNSNKLFRL